MEKTIKKLSLIAIAVAVWRVNKRLDKEITLLRNATYNGFEKISYRVLNQDN